MIIYCFLKGLQEYFIEDLQIWTHFIKLNGVYLLYNFYILKEMFGSFIEQYLSYTSICIMCIQQTSLAYTKLIRTTGDTAWSYPYRGFRSATELYLQDWLLWRCYNPIAVISAKSAGASSRDGEIYSE